MKKIVIIFLFFVTCPFNKVCSQNMNDSIPVVLSPGTDNKTEINKIRNYISTLQKANYLGYCVNHNVFMIYIDPAYHGNAQVFVSNLTTATGVGSILLKQGTIDAIREFCQLNSAAEAEKNKQMFGN